MDNAPRRACRLQPSTSKGREARWNSNSPRSAPIRPNLRSPKSPRRKRTRQPRRNGRFASQNLPPPRPPLTTKHFSKAGLKQVLRPQTPRNPPAKSDRILPPLRFLRPPLIGMRRLRFESTPPHPHSRHAPTSLNPKAPSPGRPARRSAPASNRADQRRHYGCRRAHRRLPTSRDAIPTRNRGSPGGPRVVSRAIPSEPLRGQEHPRNASRAAGPNPRRAARLHILPGTTGAPASLTSTLSATTDAAASPGGLRDKLTTFTAERMQPRRDAEQVRGATQAATGVIASLQALEQQETTGILNKIRDAAKTNGGIENVLSEMRPGGQFEDLRKEFNTVLSHDQGFAAAYDKATGAIADYAETRAALPPPSLPAQRPKPRPPANPRSRDRRSRKSSSRPIKDGQSAFNDLARKRQGGGGKTLLGRPTDV